MSRDSQFLQLFIMQTYAYIEKRGEGRSVLGILDLWSKVRLLIHIVYVYELLESQCNSIE